MAAEHGMIDGKYRMLGANTVWDDIRITPGAFDFPGVADPTLVNWQPGGAGATYKIYEFAQADEIHANVQVPHSYKEGTDLYVHVHWTPKDRGALEDTKTVAWKADISWANKNAAFPASTTYDMTDTCNGVDHRHEKTPFVQMDGAGKTISSILQIRLYRDVGDTWDTDTPGNRPCFLDLDFHYEMNDIGSQTSSSKE